MKWESNKKGWNLTQAELSKGSIFSLVDCGINISIHKYVGCGDDLFLDCKRLNIDNMDLKTDDFENAVKTAKSVVKDRFLTLQENIFKFLNDDSENEFVNK